MRFDSHEKCSLSLYVMISVKLSSLLAGLVSVCSKISGKCLYECLYVVIFSATINMISDKLCVLVLLMKLLPFIPLSVTVVAFQGHTSIIVKQF